MTEVTLSTSTRRPTLRQGASGSDVVAIQEMLNAAGVTPSLTADGVFGAGTATAVKAFQRANDLEVDGVVGASTWAALEAASGGASGACGARSLSSPDVARLPVSAAAFDAFAKALGLRASGAGEDLGGLLADALEIPSMDASIAVEPGRLESLLGALTIFRSAAALSDRLGALVDFYADQASLPEERRASAQRLLVVSLAMSQIGSVSAHEASPTDADERYGWARLDEFFYTSFGDESYGVSNVRYLARDLMAWCGIFALWANKTAGAPLGVWRIGHGIGDVSGICQVRVGSDPHLDVLPGDIGYVSSPYQHHYVVVSVDASGAVTSVDGNSTEAAHACTRTGAIVSTSHTISGTTAFYRASTLG